MEWISWRQPAADWRDVIMKRKIVLDSSSNLWQLPGVDYACVPLKIITDEQE